MECAERRVEFCTAAAVRNLGSPVQGELSAKPTEGLYPLTRYSVYTMPLL